MNKMTFLELPVLPLPFGRTRDEHAERETYNKYVNTDCIVAFQEETVPGDSTGHTFCTVTLIDGSTLVLNISLEEFKELLSKV
jgi:hypothetical protein